MKKLLVLGAALGFAIVCLIRFNLVAKEPAEGVSGGPAQPAASAPAAVPAEKAGVTDPVPAKAVLTAVPPEKSDATGAANQAARERLTYDGKKFQQWLDEFHAELNPVRRTEAIKALTAFGARGYGKEAAEPIVIDMREYGKELASTPPANNSPIRLMILAAEEAFESSDRSRPGIAPRDSVPILVRELKEGPTNGRYFAARILYDIGPEARSTIPVLLDVVRNDTDSQVRTMAFYAVAAADKAGETTMSLVEELARGKDRLLAVRAILTAAADARRASGAEPSELPKKLKPFVKMVIEAANDPDPELRLAAVRTLFELRPVPKDPVPALIGLLEKGDSPECQFIFSILDRLSPDAGKTFLPALRKAAEANRKSGGDGSRWIADRIQDVIRKIEGGLPPSASGSPSGRIRPSPRGAAKGPPGPSDAKKPRTPAVPSGKAASEGKKAGP